MSGEEIATVKDLGRLFHKDALILCTPGVLTGIAMMLIVRRFRHFAVLPCCLLAIPVVFHIVLAASGVSIKEAQSSLGHGWLAKHTPSTKFWDSWEHYDFRKVQWGAIPAVIPTWFAMYFVVSFSSCLDVAAIQVRLMPISLSEHTYMLIFRWSLVHALTSTTSSRPSAFPTWSAASPVDFLAAISFPRPSLRCDLRSIPGLLGSQSLLCL